MLKYWLLLIVTTLIFTSCRNNQQETNRLETVKQYFVELNLSDLEKASTHISDNIIISEGEFTQASTKSTWFTQFRWDSVFSPTYEIIELKEVDCKVEAIISKECKRIRFLNDSATVVKEIFEFKDGKISREHIFEYLVFDFNKWQSRRDTLVAWIDINHPELSGFIYDQTIKGGQNYLTAIEYYEGAQ